MSTISRTIAPGWVITAALCVVSVATADPAAIRPGDDAITCEQIATELSPYAQQIAPNIQALGATQQQLYAQSRQMGEKRRMEEAALVPLWEAGAVDPTGASKRAAQVALMAQQAKERAENQAFLNSPLAKQNKAQTEQLMAQGQQMQSKERLQRLLQLAQEKHCDKR